MTDPRYNELTNVWLWEDFPARKDFGGKDTGIDLVARTEMGDYWAIQCKCYDEKASIDKPAVDSFLATSSRTFLDPETLQTTRFAHRVWVATTNRWGNNAEEAIQNQEPPVSRVNLFDLENSPVDWEKLYNKQFGKAARAEGKQPLSHQLNAISAANRYFIEQGHDRGKLIMACGTGKTYTALRMAESILGQHGLVLFLVPSIALLGQSLNAWAADAQKDIKAICICSDTKASRKNNNDDDTDDSIVDLALPASTNPKTICRQLLAYKAHDGLVVVFSTYQSIDAVIDAQRTVLDATDGRFGTFDFIICDEAHRTTGVNISGKDESNFTKIHSNDNVKGIRRLYMTATPRLYGQSAKIKASEKNCILCSMDDEKLYGEEFFRVSFSEAVQRGLLTDYKVLVLTISENEIPDNLRNQIKVQKDRKELNVDDTAKLIGVINGLSKIIKGDEGKTWQTDPRMMHRAVAFCANINGSAKCNYGDGSKTIASLLPEISEEYYKSLSPEAQKHTVSIQAKHIDGSMGTVERNEILSWLKEEPETESQCRVVTNVRCLSEGVDVPALDAVLFLSPRNSQVDVVQSVGRIMRNFRKGQPDEKKYGYIIIPIVVPADVPAEEALNDNKNFAVVWSILNALRSHDDHFNAEVNKIALNKAHSEKIIVGTPGLSSMSSTGQSAIGMGQATDNEDTNAPTQQQIATQLQLFTDLQQGIYAKLVEKCGDRMYWENWAKDVGQIARKLIARIAKLVQDGPHEADFTEFLRSLQENLNPTINEGQAIEMLAQHMITRPVFDALFKDYMFVKNNTVSRSMQRMIDLLSEEGFDKDTAVLEKFYDSVRTNVGDIDNLEGKQTIIKNLYEKFFAGAFPLTVEKMGIVYTPVPCVDFIIRSVDDILKKEFNTSLTEENVHILDPFTGTGTFITRLLQSGLIKHEDMERKYLNEIHCNEIVLLAYYIADVNIESVFHSIVSRDTYLPYDGICLTDTFQTTEDKNRPRTLFPKWFPENSENVEKQKKAPVRVIIGNPPYSVGQKSTNDNAQNTSYPYLESRIANTYAARSTANLAKSLYDSYIKAFRWSSDRIAENKDGGIIAFISNGAWLDGNAQDGMRAALQSEFSDIYVLNLRGNQRTSGELSRREGGKIFGSGSRTPIAITILVKNPAKPSPATIHYHDIGDYLTREQKLDLVKKFRSVSSRSLEWETITPNAKHDWINQRDGVFDTLIPVFPTEKFKISSNSFFSAQSCGILTAKDAYLYNYSSKKLEEKVRRMIDFYNEQRLSYVDKGNTMSPKDFVHYDQHIISWSDMFLNDIAKNKEYSYEENYITESQFRPYVKQYFEYQKPLIQRTYQQTKLFPSPKTHNTIICVSGIGVSKPFSCIITNNLPDYELIGKSQCFPLYYYEERKVQEASLFDEPSSDDKYIRRDGVTDWILKQVRSRFSGAKNLTKEHIFYYVYGLLHSQDYRTRFADDLRKSLPRIPIVDDVNDFMAFSKAGKQLADLHLNYEKDIFTDFAEENGHLFRDISIGENSPLECKVQQYGVTLDYSRATTIVGEHIEKTEESLVLQENALYDKYAIKDKMRFAKVRNEAGKLVDDKTTILFNKYIKISNIPAKAYEYVVNGKSAIEWIMERYAMTTDKASGISNNPNDWAREHRSPRYILDLLLSVINLSIQSVDIIETLPKLKFS